MSESIWDYFERFDDDESKKARCLICSKIYCFKTTIFNLKSHLIKKHRNDIDANEEVLKNLVNNKSLIDRRVSNTRSAVWHYFEKVSEIDGMANCLLCEKTFSYKSTSNNLRTHLRRVHTEIYENSLEEANEELGETFEYEEFTYLDNDTESEALWNYYEREGGRARCVVCRALLAATAEDLTAHLAEKHPKLILYQHDSDSDKEESNFIKDVKQKTQDDDYTDVVYLDEVAEAQEKQRVLDVKRKKRIKCEQSCSPDEVPNKKKQLKEEETDIFVKRIKREQSCSPDDVPKKKQIKEEEEETDFFVKYVSSLLKEMPRELTMKLQMEVINMIMVAKLNYEASQNTEKSLQNVSNIVEYKKIENKEVTTGTPKNIVISVPNRIASQGDVKKIEVNGAISFRNNTVIPPILVKKTFIDNRNGNVTQRTDFKSDIQSFQSTSYTISNQNVTKNDQLLQNNLIVDKTIGQKDESSDVQNKTVMETVTQTRILSH